MRVATGPEMNSMMVTMFFKELKIRDERERELERGLRLRFGLVHRKMIFFRSLEFLFGRRDGVSTYCVEKERKGRESARKR